MTTKTNNPTTKLLTAVDTGDLAIGIQINAQVGANRTITMTSGIPIAVTPADLNAYMDKMVAVIDRQNDKGILEQCKLALLAAEKDLITQTEQRAGFESRAEMDFRIANRKGDYRPTESQQKQLANYDQSIRALREDRIPKFKKDIADLEARIAAGATSSGG